MQEQADEREETPPTLPLVIPEGMFSINPNDINNPVKIRLSIHRLHDYYAAKDLLADLRGKYDRIALNIIDPSIFGKVSHYYATVETNDRGSLHLHGLLWLHGNIELPSLIDDIADPREHEYRARVVRYVDSVFHECLDEDAGKAVRQQRKPIHPLPDVKDLRPTRHFLKAMNAIDSTFSKVWINQIEANALSNPDDEWQKTFPDGIKISEIFERSYRSTTSNSNTKGAFSTFRVANHSINSTKESN
ncbi:hypothetical protein HRG_001741 [Hirsutella rhossiliensis]